MTTESKLFTPSRIGPLTLRNRTIRSAAFEGMCPGHRPSQMLLDYHRSIAAGGIGMTTVAYAAVSRSGLSFPHQLWLRKEVVNDLRLLTGAVHQEGAAASIQLGHCGNMSKKSITGCMPLSPSGGLNIYSPTWSRKMTGNDITQIVRSFADAVAIARESGFDAVEIHAGHGYLISQFLSPYSNHREDEFGGSLENRTRFLKLVIRSVMKAAGNDIAVIVKMNMSDGFDGGMETDECLHVARLLEQEGCHALVLSGGFVSKAPMYIMRGSMPVNTLAFYMRNIPLKLGVYLAGKWMIPSVPFKEAYFLEEALKFRKTVKLPLIYVGGLISGKKINEVLDNGFEFVSMARALINEPGFVNRLKLDPDAINQCTCSNYCIARMYSINMACHQHVDGLPRCIHKEVFQENK
ncbi:MAG TPA: NADH:flavin oxidoreductase [Prolixibacteraceae bacterium]|nr:NADH:flavin oxidoreductase [Prolixibacteraceae bacterium]